jgi:RimJ/RimL family protein N-acetyltransferase
MTPLLTTDRLSFQPFTRDDLPLLVELHGDPAVMRYLSAGGQAWSEEILAGKLARFVAEQAERGFSKWQVRRRQDGRFIGRAGFSPFEGDVELGFILGREAWGHGYASECARALLAWMFREHPEIGRIVAFARTDNRASRRVLEKVGMTPTGMRLVNGFEHAFYEARRSILR